MNQMNQTSDIGGMCSYPSRDAPGCTMHLHLHGPHPNAVAALPTTRCGAQFAGHSPGAETSEL